MNPIPLGKVALVLCSKRQAQFHTQAVQELLLTVANRRFTQNAFSLAAPNVKSDLAPSGRSGDLAVQVSKKRDVLVEVSNVGCVRRTAFGKDESDAKSDALSVIWFQSQSPLLDL